MHGAFAGRARRVLGGLIPREHCSARGIGSTAEHFSHAGVLLLEVWNIVKPSNDTDGSRSFRNAKILQIAPLQV